MALFGRPEWGCSGVTFSGSSASEGSLVTRDTGWSG
ncbi:Uncharacterised protein [Mycobacteroides abscessus subsp. abscessus]|nr:Uncharacterised protein [Mycobacteroides abscessus subsp. abscessus]